MSGSARHHAIKNSMSQTQRLALEAHMVSSKEKQHYDPSQRAESANMEALCNTDSSHAIPNDSLGRSGICRSCACGKTYGYYAKVSINNLVFWGRIHRDLTDAVRDHILMIQVVQRIRCLRQQLDFQKSVSRAFQDILSNEALNEHPFLRTVSVRFSAEHWIGRGLAIHFSTLEAALAAWHRLQLAQGEVLFASGHVTPAYTPEKADEQWRRIRKAYVDLQTDARRRAGQRLRRIDVEARLATLEATYRAKYLQKVARFRRQRELRHPLRGRAYEISSDGVLQRRLQRVLRIWEHRLLLATKRSLSIREKRRREQVALERKRRWDGKESMDEFKRRILVVSTERP
eukprot:TRINITY_DN19811_c0_g1_i1.p1 TRINITY_DN19811_c0_g1~~TRINITY_DN19811_c0_g1_i1.p1  ORF type:complete len:345 (-),score=37.81 TRINITY_DN19811_c0_g1_i1:166-1200(-)